MKYNKVNFINEFNEDIHQEWELRRIENRLRGVSEKVRKDWVSIWYLGKNGVIDTNTYQRYMACATEDLTNQIMVDEGRTEEKFAELSMLLDKLNDREKTIFTNFINGDTMTEIGDKLGVSKQRVHFQWKELLKTKLKEVLDE